MKKLIWLMILGVIFFIGGQWIGLSLSEQQRIDEQSLFLPLPAQNGSASDVANPLIPESVIKAVSDPKAETGPDSGTQEASSGSGANP